MHSVYFDSVRDIIVLYKSEKGLKNLRECPNTIEAYKKEDIRSNPYRRLADNFLKYEDDASIKENNEDYYFYKYLKSLSDDTEYDFPLKNGEFISVEINLFKPYESISDKVIIVHPRWHLLVSCYAYIDVIYNHCDDIFQKKTSINPPLRKKYYCKSMNIWMDECKNDSE